MFPGRWPSLISLTTVANRRRASSRSRSALVALSSSKAISQKHRTVKVTVCLRVFIVTATVS